MKNLGTVLYLICFYTHAYDYHYSHIIISFRSTQKAVIVTKPKPAGLVSSRAIPKLRDDYVLVKTVSVGLNPSDWKHIDSFSLPGVLLEGNYSGVDKTVSKHIQLS